MNFFKETYQKMILKHSIKLIKVLYILRQIRK